MTSTTDLRGLAIQFAQEHAFLADPDEAEGLCFWAAVTFANFASSYGHSVQLIRWEVYDSGPYSDHWAVVLNGNRLIDLTRSQVDGQTGLFWHTTSYPDGYFCARRYPAMLFLKEYRCLSFTRGQRRFPQSFLNSITVARAQFDAIHVRPTPKMQMFGMVAMAAIFYAFFAWRVFA